MLFLTDTTRLPGTFYFTMRAQNVFGFVDKTYILNIMGIGNLASVSSGKVGTRPQFPTQWHGGISPFSFSVVGGELPTGLSLRSSGLISGDARRWPADYDATVQIVDAVLRQQLPRSTLSNQLTSRLVLSQVHHRPIGRLESGQFQPTIMHGDSSSGDSALAFPGHLRPSGYDNGNH